VTAPPAPPPEVLAAFGASRTAVETLPGGHIHAGVVVAAADGRRLVVQRLNTSVFADPHRLVHNATVVVAALQHAGVPTLELVPTADGEALVFDRANQPWRAYRWVDGREADPRRATDRQAVAAAFGAYAAALADVDGRTLVPTIERFHDIDRRVRAFLDAVDADRVGRLAAAHGEVDRCRRTVARLADVREFDAWGDLPRRIVHHDAKPANAIIRPDGRVCVIDLDTTMVGTVLSDVGELVRSCTRTVAEDDDSVAPALHPEQVGQIVAAWRQGWNAPLLPAERHALPAAGIICTLENAVRFLTDHLDGDRYFRVTTPGQNLARFRAQLTHAQVQLDAIDDLRRAIDHELRGAE
jgi:Ser/Thr protein kinase RdoA (MazF antagonist)